ncbi:tRNA pseudouridine(55) synthase TruB [bacterium]|nr:tRNA pseudouridine(55) synthase TruB [bacterium]
MISGILLIDKPAGITSFGVVAKIRGILRRELKQKNIKVGHAGTLDPDATGLLIVLIGKATKLQDSFMTLPKTYTGKFKLGVKTNTGDASGEVVESAEIPKDLSSATLLNVAQKLLGKRLQMPPQFSAKKINGQRAYDLARRGEVVKLEPKQIEIFQLDLGFVDQVTLSYALVCSHGTYVRSLAEEVGNALGTVAHALTIRREQIGPYTTVAAKSFQEILDGSGASLLASISSVVEENIQQHVSK